MFNLRRYAAVPCLDFRLSGFHFLAAPLNRFGLPPRHPATRGHDLHIGVVCRKPDVAKRAAAPTKAAAAASAGVQARRR